MRSVHAPIQSFASVSLARTTSHSKRIFWALRSRSHEQVAFLAFSFPHCSLSTYLCPLLPARQILLLLRRERIDVHIHRFELRFRDERFDLLRYVIDSRSKFLLRHPLGGKGLRRKAHVHHGGGMPFGSGRIYKAALSEHIDLFPSDIVCLHVLTHYFRLATERAQIFEIYLDIEVPGVADDRAAFHRLEVLASDHIDVACDRAEKISDIGRALHWHHIETVHALGTHG